MLVKLGEHPLSFAEDLIAYRTITALKRPVIVRVPGEDKVPYELADAIKMALKGKGFCTRKPVRLEDIEPLQLLAPDKDDDDADNNTATDDDDDDADNDGDDAPPAKKKKKQQQQPKPQASSSSSSRHHHHLPFFINVEYHARFVATLSGLACAFASKNDIDRVKELVRFGAKVNAPEGANGGTVLHSAVARSASACVRWLIEEAGADPFVPNAHGTTPFLLAVAVNALSIVRYLHQWATSSKRKDPGVLQRMLHATDHEGASAFVLAMRRDLVSMMVLLNDVLQAPLDAFEIAPPSGVMSLSPLVTAVEYRKPASALRMLVQAGARLSVAQKGDVGLLELAAAQGSVGHVAMLLRLGLIAPDARAFRAAARHNHVRILRLLANPKAVPSEEDCPDDYLDCIGTVAWPDYYYDHDDHDDKEEEKEALLHLARLCPAHALAAAVANDSFQAAQELAALRVPRTPALVEAVRGNRLWAVEMLLMLEPAPAAAAWPDWHDTPLTLAVLYRRTDMVALMASRLPLPLLNQPRAYDGRNPLDLALLQAPDGEIAYILLAAGASPTAAAVAKPLRPQPQEEEEHPQPQQQHHEEERTTKRRRIVVLATTSIILRDSPTTTTPKVKTPLQPPTTTTNFGAGSPRA